MPRKRKSSSADDARSVAALVLTRVWDESAWAAPTLDAELARARCDARDARLATELVYGVLRTTEWLDGRISAHTKNERWRKDSLTRAHLLIAAYSLSFLERVPGFAAVDRAVEAVHGAGGARVAGFANAVLRKLATEPPKRDQLPGAVESSLPGWLRSELDKTLGEGGARTFASGAAPPIGLCVRAHADRSEWIERLREAAPHAELDAGRASPRAILLRGSGDPRRLPGVDDAWFVQEEGAQVVAQLAGARAGEEVLDACAGRGQKTLLLCEAVGSVGAVDAADLHPQKLARLAASPAGGMVRARFAVDWTRGSGEVSGLYDRVIVDAPCTGVGTLRRRPEIATRLGAGDPARMAALQLAIARGAARHVRDGGRFIYAVCSVLREETDDVAAALAQDLDPAPFDTPLAATLAPPGAHTLRLLPHVHGTDGYFIASFLGSH